MDDRTRAVPSPTEKTYFGHDASLALALAIRERNGGGQLVALYETRQRQRLLEYLIDEGFYDEVGSGGRVIDFSLISLDPDILESLDLSPICFYFLSDDGQAVDIFGAQPEEELIYNWTGANPRRKTVIRRLLVDGVGGTSSDDLGQAKALIDRCLVYFGCGA